MEAENELQQDIIACSERGNHSALEIVATMIETNKVLAGAEQNERLALVINYTDRRGNHTHRTIIP